jgi:undecaprenyl-diphosphatase
MAAIYELLKAVILGIVEGITEWLPISSTGHMILVDEFLKLNMSGAFKEMFLVVIQLGAILAVVIVFWKKLNPFTYDNGIKLKSGTVSMWLKILVACVPAVIIGLLFDDQIDALFYNYQTVSVTLILYGIVFIIIESRNKNKTPKINEISGISYKTALMIGVFQLLSLIPGTSRSGATIIGAMLIGTSRTIAAEFTFFLAIPVMVGTSLLKLIKLGLYFSGLEIEVLLSGMLIAFVVSIISIKFLMSYFRKHDFKVFGWYWIVLGIIVILYFSARLKNELSQQWHMV